MKTRKLSNSLFIILVFSLHSWSLYGQYILVPRQHIGAAATGAAIGQSFRRSMEELNKLSGSLREIDQAMEQVRKDYWATSNFSGPYMPPLQYKGNKTLEKEYLDLLTSKDMWYLLFAFQDYVFANNSASESQVKGSGDAMLRIMSLARGQGVQSASPVDRGINEQALEAFKGWSFQVCSTWGQTGKGYPDWDAFYKAIETNVDYYRTYVQLRDESEFFYRNPFSPLKGGSPEMFYHATSVSTGLYKSFEVSKSEYDFLVSKSNKREIDQRISDFRKVHQGEYNSEGMMDFHWKLAEASRDLFGIYLIKRKYLVSWRKANEIFQRRIKRYGKAKVDGILNALWAEKDKEDSNFPTRPDILRKSSKNLRNFLNENEDCSAKQLGESTIWYDLMDLATSEMDRVETKKEYIKNILNGDSNIYNNMVADFLEETHLLAAYYIATAYGKSLFKSDMGYEIRDEEKLRRYNSTEYLNILSGFAIAYKHCKTIGFLKSLEIGRESEMLTAGLILEMKRSIQNADCDNLIRVAAFDDAKVERLDPCGVKHSQSFSYRKICAVYWAYDTQEESATSEEQDYTQYKKASKFENHKLYKITDGAMIPPPVLGCDNLRFDGLVCYLKALEMDISYSFKEELKARGIDISKNTELAGRFYIEPDGSYTPSYITSKEPALIEAFESALKKSTRFGAFKLNDNSTAVRTEYACFLLQKNSK